VSTPPESTPPDGSRKAARPADGQVDQRPRAPRSGDRLRQFGNLAEKCAPLSWAVTLILLAVIFGALSGYRAYRWGGRGLWVFLALCPAITSFIVGATAAALGAEAQDPGVAAQGKIAMASGCLLVPGTLFVLFLAFRV
jgi:hypothetical protein